MQHRIMKIFLPFQKLIFVFLLILFLLTVLILFIVTKPNTNYGSHPTLQEYKQCSTSFCKLIVKVSVHPQDLIQNTILIFKNNTLSGIFDLVNKKYVTVAPLRSLVLLGVDIGVGLKNDGNSYLKETIFPHGWLEIISVILFTSFYYSFLASISYSIIKRKLLFSIKAVVIQILVIELLISVAAFLEAISIFSKSI